MTGKAMVVMSGGLDSTTALYHTQMAGWEVLAISFDYGQRHRKELEHAKTICQAIDVPHEIVDLTRVGQLISGSGSSLVSDTEVPEGHYGEESMRATVVPNRNMIMASIAVGCAIGEGCDIVVMGVHAGDHFIYPDCRPEYFSSLQVTVNLANEGFNPPIIETPFIYLSKNDIAQRAFDLQVPIMDTWSCYKGGDIHCGKCGTCVERLEAIASTGNPDPTPYEDESFWLEALKRDTV